MTLRTEGIWPLWAGAQAAGRGRRVWEGSAPRRTGEPGLGAGRGCPRDRHPEESGRGSNRRVAAWAGEMVSRAGVRRVKPWA